MTNPTALGIAKIIRERKASPIEVINEHLRWIERINPSLNAFIELRADECIKEARKAEEAVMRGGALGPLHGVPLGMKSSIAVAGMKHESGSRSRAGIIAKEDAALLKRLKEGGAIILGTTNVPEMLMAYETENPIYGRTNNPWSRAHTPGGSSGGEAAAIASGLSAGGVGSDGGGSIRLPAHFSGICGLKPTPGRISAAGHIPESMGPFAMLGVLGPMARTVDDVELLFRVMAGWDIGDTFSAPVPVRDASKEELGEIRVGYFEEDESCPVTEETKRAVRFAAQCLRQRGVGVVPFRPSVLEKAREYWWTLFVDLASELISPIFAGREDETSSILRYASKDGLSKKQIVDAWFGRDELRLRLFREMQGLDGILCPVSASPAFLHGEKEWLISGKSVDYMQAMSYTQWFNLLGNPAVVVPVQLSGDGLPIGVQIVGMPYAEEMILQIARLVESESGFEKNQPTISAVHNYASEKSMLT